MQISFRGTYLFTTGGQGCYSAWNGAHLLKKSTKNSQAFAKMFSDRHFISLFGADRRPEPNERGTISATGEGGTAC